VFRQRTPAKNDRLPVTSATGPRIGVRRGIGVVVRSHVPSRFATCGFVLHRRAWLMWIRRNPLALEDRAWYIA
jgi:hypothetical protein